MGGLQLETPPPPWLYLAILCQLSRPTPALSPFVPPAPHIATSGTCNQPMSCITTYLSTLAATTDRRLPFASVTHQRPPSHPITRHRLPSPNIDHCNPLSPVITHRHPLSPAITSANPGDAADPLNAYLRRLYGGVTPATSLNWNDSMVDDALAALCDGTDQVTMTIGGNGTSNGDITCVDNATVANRGLSASQADRNCSFLSPGALVGIA